MKRQLEFANHQEYRCRRATDLHFWPSLLPVHDDRSLVFREQHGGQRRL